MKLDKSMRGLGFTRCSQEQAVYTRSNGLDAVIVGVYVDDLIVTDASKDEIKVFKQQMKNEFEMSDLGLLSYYLGIEVHQKRDCVTLRQSAYAWKVLLQFGMADYNMTKCPMEPKLHLRKDSEGTVVDPTEFRRVVGCLRYLAHTRLDLSYAVGMVSRYMVKPTTMHHQAIKHILRYVKGTINFGLAYGIEHEKEELVGFTDSNLAGDTDERKSTSGILVWHFTTVATSLDGRPRSKRQWLCLLARPSFGGNSCSLSGAVV